MMASTSLPVVLVAQALPPVWVASLETACYVISGTPGGDGLDPVLELHLAAAEGLLSMLTLTVDEALLARMPRLRVVSNMAVGVNNIDVAACSRRGIPVGHTPGLLTAATADLTLALLLALARRLPDASQAARNGQWLTWRPTDWLGRDIEGKTLGIVGLGRIGAAVARRAQAFGLRVVYHNRRHSPLADELGVTWLFLDDLLRESDFVCLHVPLTEETERLIDARALRLMKSSALLINVARGPVVDTPALVRALADGWIAGAGLDVTDPEPLPPGHPLYQLPNCLILPHIGSATEETRRRMAEMAAANLLAGLAGRPLLHSVNPEVAPRHG